MITITAVFKGQNGSLGYVTGKKYVLTLKQHIKSQAIWIVRQEDGHGECMYAHTIAFFENWTNVETDKK